MSAGVKLGADGLRLAAMVGGGAAVGAAAGPIDVGGSRTHDTIEEDSSMSSDLPAGGLLVAQDGYAFELEDRLADAVGEVAGRFDGLVERVCGHRLVSS